MTTASTAQARPAGRLPVTRATRYVAPLREGGSLPGLVEADDLGTWVVKFRGAGQGPGALVAEIAAGELARVGGLPVPALSLIEVPEGFGRAEPDPEIKELIEASEGLNLAMDFLPGALPFMLPAPPAGTTAIDPHLAAEIVLFDALTTNIDRTPRNPNLLVWHGSIHLIDHGAAFFRQHGDRPLADFATSPTPALADHVLLPATTVPALEAAAGRLFAPMRQAVPAVLDLIPDEWLGPAPGLRREDFRIFLDTRLAAGSLLVEEVSGYITQHDMGGARRG